MLNHIKLKHPTTVGSVRANSSNATNSASGGGRKSRMDTFVTSRHCGPDKANKINDIITDMVATDMLPISFVKGTGFRRLLQSLEPSYVPCSIKLITARLYKRYEECAHAIKKKS